MKRGNGQGTIAKLSGNRRKPYAVKITTGWTEKGTQKYKYISYHRTQREALQALNDYIKDPYILSDRTLTDLWDDWYPLQNKTDGTLKNYRVAWNHLEPLHNIKLSKLDRVTLQRYYDNLHGTKNVANNIKKTLQQMIDYAVKRGEMPLTALNLHDVIDLYSAPLQRTVKREIITSDEIDRLWKMSDSNMTARTILVYLYTGLRFSELYELKEDNAHPDHFDIVKAKTKAGIRTVPLSDKVKKLLPIDPVPDYQTFYGRFKEVLPNHNIHDTRHTFITMLTEAGVDPRIIKTIVGHSTKDITEVYTHITLDVMLEAVNKI